MIMKLTLLECIELIETELRDKNDGNEILTIKIRNADLSSIADHLHILRVRNNKNKIKDK